MKYVFLYTRFRKKSKYTDHRAKFTCQQNNIVYCFCIIITAIIAIYQHPSVHGVNSQIVASKRNEKLFSLAMNLVYTFDDKFHFESLYDL